MNKDCSETFKDCFMECPSYKYCIVKIKRLEYDKLIGQIKILEKENEELKMNLRDSGYGVIL